MKPLFPRRTIEEKTQINATVPVALAERLDYYEAYVGTPRSEIIAGLLDICFKADAEFEKELIAGTIKLKTRAKKERAKAAAR